MSYATARRFDAGQIPVIDVAPLAGGAADAVAAVGAEMREAAERIGFFYVRNHGIDADADRARPRPSRGASSPSRSSARSRSQPDDRHRGFLHVGQAKMYDEAKVDLKESFIWGLDVGEDDPGLPRGQPHDRPEPLAGRSSRRCGRS